TLSHDEPKRRYDEATYDGSTVDRTKSAEFVRKRQRAEELKGCIVHQRQPSADRADPKRLDYGHHAAGNQHTGDDCRLFVEPELDDRRESERYTDHGGKGDLEMLEWECQPLEWSRPIIDPNDDPRGVVAGRVNRRIGWLCCQCHLPS